MSDDKKTPQDDHASPANPDNQIDLRRQSADAEHAAKIAGDIPPRSEPDRPVAPSHRRKGRHGVGLKETPSTGHEWDGITEYDNPMPRWWVWTFYATILWSIGYAIAFPAWPLLTALKRVCAVTGTQSTCSGTTPICFSMTPITLRHSSTM